MSLDRPKAEGFQVNLAVQALRSGGVVAYPTEAVWGLGCDPQSDAGLRALLAIKRRDIGKGLILVAADIIQFSALIAPLGLQQRLALQDTWPGPVTWLIPHRGRVHPLVHGGRPKVALRVSDHPLVQALCTAFGGPLVSSSANPQSRSPAMDAATVRRYFGGGVDYVLPGALGGLQRPTEIRDLEGCRVIRKG